MNLLPSAERNGRKLRTEVETLRAERKTVSGEVARALRERVDPTAVRDRTVTVPAPLQTLLGAEKLAPLPDGLC